MKVAIVGSRNWPNFQQVRDYVMVLPAGTEVVSGGAPGVDAAAEGAARYRWYRCKDVPQPTVFRADWSRFGRSAGPRRNAQMVEYADRVVAFWDGKSPGTKHTIGLAKKAGKPVEIITPDGVVSEK